MWSAGVAEPGYGLPDTPDDPSGPRARFALAMFSAAARSSMTSNPIGGLGRGQGWGFPRYTAHVHPGFMVHSPVGHHGRLLRCRLEGAQTYSDRQPRRPAPHFAQRSSRRRAGAGSE